MKKSAPLIILAFFLVQAAFAQFSVTTNLNKLTITKNTAEKPQSKVWIQDGKHWTVLCNADGAAVWKLDGNTWKKALTLSAKTNRRADCKVVGNVVHILLFHETDTDLISIEYMPASGTYQLWQSRTSTIRIPCDLYSETATIDVDTNGRMWLASDDNSNITVRYSDSPYSSWSAPIVIASGVHADDIGTLIALPALNKVGVFWSNQNTKRFGFKMHADGTDPNTWSTDELPASQSALNVGAGFADDHMNLKVATDGTLYCAVKTSYDTPGYPRISLLIRRPSGSWDNLYSVSEIGTRGIVVLNEQTGKIRVIYASSELGGDILYKESSTSPISFGPQYTLVAGTYNNPTSIKSNYTSEVVILASTSVEAVGVLATDNSSTSVPLPDTPKLKLPAKGASGVSTAPALVWDPAKNATSYQVQLSTVSNFATLVTDSSNILSETLAVTGLAYSTKYYWRAKSFNTKGGSNWSPVWDFTTGTAPMPETPKLRLPAKGASGVSASPALVWDPAKNATSYQVQLSTVSNFATLVTDSSNILSETLAVTGLAYSTKYYWRAKSFNINGVSNWSPVWDFTTGTAPVVAPAAPVLASPANNTTGMSLAPTVSWNASATATTYQIQLANAADFLSPVLDNSNLTNLSFTFSNLASNTQYFWRVRAYNNVGGSTWSTIWSFTTLTPLVAPVLASPASGTTGTSLSPTLSWNASTNATTYQMQLATAADFLLPVVDNSNLTSLSITLSNLTFNTQYFWRVRAINSSETSNWSAIWSFTTMSQPVSLVGHWQMDDPAGNTLSDASGNGNHATTSGNPGFVTGVFGQSLHLNGTNQYATVPSSTTLSPGSAITLAAWIKPERTGLRQVILKKGIAADGYELSLTSSAKITFRYNQVSGGNNYQLISSGVHPTDGQTWMHIAATFDGSTIKIYLDGVLNKSLAIASAPGINSNTESFSIGAQSNGSSRLQGDIDDSRIYNIALTASDISSIATVPVARMSARLQTRSDLAASPNPFRDATKVNFTAPDNGEYAVILYNMAGKPVEMLKQGNARAGEKLSAEIDGSKLLRGLYMIRLQTSKTSQTLKLMLDQ